MNLETVLRLMRAAIDIKAMIEQGIDVLSEDDQSVAKEAYADLRAENDDAHERLQKKLLDATS